MNPRPRPTYLNWPLANRPKKPYNVAIWWYLTTVLRQENFLSHRPPMPMKVKIKASVMPAQDLIK
ncbi:MAG: hypothetical protein CO133_01495 [Candidatus Komeilibacteria bacterium CG_4_9_14_3_um_filter_37_5]|nr:MAG: hypothetical protein CO133_01495 [Candidatus Komeilibacteria bacterium CG_4_9_14_3_um_filter_37_5]